ncbi:5'-adenylylsulfate reductase-like 4 [Punica granatum]|uniref:Thioredoxin domain-containing protein n=2 Tax=Punica granatum TaxID=22663 RepID=A0A218X4V0_PUNGR|nr:5'-adenylylsulfate reductase-like 4 [Punica granatum]OWM79954.1 hypothetical protein CDL15_Pgr006258 [Punica granatum]PKI54248.1 hypothetical protein CRG98_025363 [Punica granatum]
MRGVWEAGIVVLLALGRLAPATSASASAGGDPTVCGRESVAESVLGFWDSYCPLHGLGDSIKFVRVTEGDELSLQRALTMVHRNSHKYVAVLFYASWCPFSRTFRPMFSLLSSLYPSISHFAIEESAVRPSILSKYGVHGFPTIFVMNSTMRVRYHGSRSLNSLVAFYSDVTGIESSTRDWTALEDIRDQSNHEKHENLEAESCPFWWARSPENLLQQETYLTLATIFVLLRVLYFLYPNLLLFFQRTWKYIRNMSPLSSLDHFLSYLKQAVQLWSCLREPSKRSNLQEGAMNARVWASKSLATVSIGEASTSRCVSLGRRAE